MCGKSLVQGFSPLMDRTQQLSLAQVPFMKSMLMTTMFVVRF